MNWLRTLLFLPHPASSVAHDVDTLHFTVITTTMLGSFGVFAIAVALSWRFSRRRVKTYVTPRYVSGPIVESVIVVGILTLFVALWVPGYLQYVALRTPPDSGLEVWVVAKQWMWEFATSEGIRSETVLVVPRDRDVRLMLTTRDVIHSFYVPAFRLKQDVVPGHTTLGWFRAERPGTYPLLCAEFCGTEHSMMRGTIVVLEPDAYARYLESRLAVRASPDAHDTHLSGESELAGRGRILAERYGCFACHTIDGQRHIAPTWAGLWQSDVELDDHTHVRADAAYLTRSMMRPEAQVVAGFDPVMPSYRGVLDAGDVAAIVEFIRLLESAPLEPVIDLPELEPRDRGHALIDAGVAAAAEDEGPPPAAFDGGTYHPPSSPLDAGGAR